MEEDGDSSGLDIWSPEIDVVSVSESSPITQHKRTIEESEESDAEFTNQVDEYLSEKVLLLLFTYYIESYTTKEMCNMPSV